MKIEIRRLTVFLLTVLLAFCLACNDHDVDIGEKSSGDDDAIPADDDSSSPDDDVNADDDDTADDDTGDDDTSPYNVEEREDLGAAWNCPLPGYCIDDYRRFMQLAAEYAVPIPRYEIRRQLTEIDAGNVETIPGPLSPEELRDAILDITNIRFLVDGINERLLVVTTIARNETAEYFETHLLFDDPWVGVFEGYLLTPKSEGPFPAVVAIHGHSDDARIFRDEYHGNEYPSHGLAILMLTMRAMEGGIAALVEHNISLDLLMDGFTLMGLRSYEAQLGMKYLRYLPLIIEDRIGLIGHSGGSSTSNLTVRIDPGISAYVSDFSVDYAEWVPVIGVYHCETIPELYPYNLLINAFSTSAAPVLSVDYGYDGEMDFIFAFFEEHLKD